MVLTFGSCSPSNSLTVLNSCVILDELIKLSESYLLKKDDRTFLRTV